MTEENKRIKIIVVEDDPLLLHAYQGAFIAKGYDVEVFFNAEDAYQAISGMSPKPALIFSDIMMPKMNGLQFLEKVRQTAELKDIPVVLVTSLEQKEHVEKANSLGVTAYFNKTHHTLKEIVEKTEECISKN